MKSVRFILLALSATVSLGVLPSCSQVSVREAVNYIMFGNKEGRLSSSETISSTSSSEADELVSSSEEYYDSAGYPIFGYDGAYPVYGYDPSSNPIYDMTQLDENSTVPSWSPLSESTSASTSDSSAGNGYAAPPSYDPHRLGPNPRLLLWYTMLKRASEAPPSARHRYGKHLFRKPRHRDYAGYGEFWGKPERDADKHKPRKPERDADRHKPRKPEWDADKHKPRKPEWDADKHKPRKPEWDADKHKPRKPEREADKHKPRKPEREADKHKRRHSEPDADKGGSREKERRGRAEKGKKKSSR